MTAFSRRNVSSGAEKSVTMSRLAADSGALKTKKSLLAPPVSVSMPSAADQRVVADPAAEGRRCRAHRSACCCRCRRSTMSLPAPPVSVSLPLRPSIVKARLPLPATVILSVSFKFVPRNLSILTTLPPSGSEAATEHRAVVGGRIVGGHGARSSHPEIDNSEAAGRAAVQRFDDDLVRIGGWQRAGIEGEVGMLAGDCEGRRVGVAAAIHFGDDTRFRRSRT